MATITQTAHEKFSNLRKRLDQLGYKQPLGLDCLPLVERLFCDLVWTTESLRKAKSELNSQLKLRSNVEDYVAPYKADNGRLVKENNELHQQLLLIRQDHEENVRGLKAEYRKLNNENEDLKLFNSQCLDKLQNYEQSAKRMAEQILLLQEKNFQAVVYTPGGRKKQLPFRRQRMDIDCLVPKPVLPEKKQGYCCTVSQQWDKMERAAQPEALDLLDLATKRCEDLEDQLSRMEQELELSDRKVENFRHQVTLRDAEIERLRVVSEGGRPLEALVQDCTDRQSDRLIQQLQLQVDLLQSRNEELESRMVELVNHEANQLSTSANPEKHFTAIGVQTGVLAMVDQLTDASCQTEQVNCVMCGTDCTDRDKTDKAQLEQIGTMLREIENGRGYLMKRIDVLAARERELIKELSTRTGPPNRRADRVNRQKSVFEQALEKRVQGLEADRQRWRFEAKTALNALDQLTRLTSLQHNRPMNRENHCTTGFNRSGVCQSTARNVRELHDITCHRRSVTPPARPNPRLDYRRRSASVDFPQSSPLDKETLGAQLRNAEQERDHYRYMWEQARYSLQRSGTRKSTQFGKQCGEKDGNAQPIPNANATVHTEELNRLRAERDSLLSLLDKFERQLIEIQSNVRVLTEERNLLNNQLSQARTELKETRDQLAQIQQSTTSTARCGPRAAPTERTDESPLTSSRILLQRLGCERDHLAELLHQMTVERDSLRDRLHALTDKGLTEKARWLQRIEEAEEELRSMQKVRAAETITQSDMTERINALETERQQLLDRLDYLNSCVADDTQLAETERNLHTVQTRLEQVEKDYEKAREDATQLRRTLRQLDQEKDTLQAGLDERTEHCALLERELAKRERQLHEYQRSSQTFEQRVLRLTETAAQRDQEYRQLGERAALLELELTQTGDARDRALRELEQSKMDLATMMHEAQSLKSQLRNEADKGIELRKRLDEAQAEGEKLRERSAFTENERADVLKQYRALTLELDEKTVRIGQCENQLTDLQHLCAVREQELASWKGQTNTLRKDLVEYQQVVHTLESQCALLTQTVSESEDRVRRLQCENEETCRELTDVRALCDRLERQAHSTQHQLTTGNLETEQLRAQLAETERELVSLRKQVDHERDTVRNLEAILNTSRDGELKARKEIQNYRAELQMLRDRFDERNTRLSEAEREVHELRTRLSNAVPRFEAETRRSSNHLGLSEAHKSRLGGQTIPSTQQRNSYRVPAPQLTSEPLTRHVLPNNWSGVLDTDTSNAVAEVRSESPPYIAHPRIQPVTQSPAISMGDNGMAEPIAQWLSCSMNPMAVNVGATDLSRFTSSKTSIASESSVTIDCSINTIPIPPSSPMIELSVTCSRHTQVEDSGRPGSPDTCSDATLLDTGPSQVTVF